MKQIAITFAIAVTAAGTNAAPGKESGETMDRFVVLARNDTQPKGHAPVLVFEYRPGEDALVKRAEMEASSWSPDRMFDTGSFDGFLRHQVDHPGKRPRYVTHFYHLDVRNWQIRRLLVSDQIIGLSINADRAWLKTDRGIRVLDRRDLTLEEKPRTFEVLQTLNDRYALIRQRGAAEKEAELFDFRTGKSVARLDLPPSDRGYPTRIQLRDDAGALAIFPGVADFPPNLGFGQKDWVTTELFLYDLQQGKRHTIPFRTQVTPGSGVPVIYLTLEMGFANDGSLKLTDGDPPRYVKVDPVSGEKSDFPNPPKNRRREPTPSDAEAIVKLVNEKSDIRMHENHYFRFAILRPGGEFLALTPDGKAFLSGDLKEATLAVLPNPSQSVDVSIHALPAAPVN